MDLIPSRLHQLNSFPSAADPQLTHKVPFPDLQRQPPAQLLPDRCPEDAAGRAAFLLSLDNVPDPFSGTPCADALLGVTLQFSPTVRVVQCGPWRLGVDQRSLLLWLGLLRSTARASAVQLNQDWKTAQLLERQMWSRIQLHGSIVVAPTKLCHEPASARRCFARTYTWSCRNAGARQSGAILLHSIYRVIGHSAPINCAVRGHAFARAKPSAGGAPTVPEGLR